MLPTMVGVGSVTGIRSFTFTPDDGVPPAVAPFAHATAAGPTLYVTGQMPTDVTGAVVGHDIATQTTTVLGNLLRVTELCGGGLADVVVGAGLPRRLGRLRSLQHHICAVVSRSSAEPHMCGHHRSGGRRPGRAGLGVLAKRRLGRLIPGYSGARSVGVAASSVAAVARSRSTTSDSSALHQDS